LPAAAVHGDGIRVVAVTRAGLPTVDIGDLVGQEGDVLHLVVTHDVEGKLEALFQVRRVSRCRAAEGTTDEGGDRGAATWADFSPRTSPATGTKSC